MQNRIAIHGKYIFIKERRVCVKPLRSRLEAIQKLKPPTTQKGCRSFAGVVNFVSIFCPELQKLLKPIYELTKKGRPFIWGDEQQKAFDEINSRLLKPPVLTCQIGEADFYCTQTPVNLPLVVPYTKYRMEKPKLIANASKRMPEAAKNYSITELEMCGLAINIASFAHLLKE